MGTFTGLYIEEAMLRMGSYLSDLILPKKKVSTWPWTNLWFQHFEFVILLQILIDVRFEYLFLYVSNSGSIHFFYFLSYNRDVYMWCHEYLSNANTPWSYCTFLQYAKFLEWPWINFRRYQHELIRLHNLKLPLISWSTKSVAICTVIPRSAEANSLMISIDAIYEWAALFCSWKPLQSSGINMESNSAGHCSLQDKQANDTNVLIYKETFWQTINTISNCWNNNRYLRWGLLWDHYNKAYKMAQKSIVWHYYLDRLVQRMFVWIHKYTHVRQSRRNFLSILSKYLLWHFTISSKYEKSSFSAFLNANSLLLLEWQVGWQLETTPLGVEA